MGAFALVDTKDAVPSSALDLWMEHLLQTALEVKLFPTPVPASASNLEALAKLWDESIDHAKEFHLNGIQTITEGDKWSMRGAVKAAWNIEFASVSSASVIGTIVSDSAHRAALRLAPEMWLAFQAYTYEADDNPSDRPQLWESFVSKWCSEEMSMQIDVTRSTLASELSRLRDQLNNKSTPPNETPENVDLPPKTQAATTDEMDTEQVSALTKSEKQVLQTLAEFDPIDLASTANIAEAMEPMKRLSPRTITPAIRKLIEAGLVERPHGTRKGARLTTRGRLIIREIAD